MSEEDDRKPKRPLTDIEQSWMDGDFEKDLETLGDQIKKDIWAHDKIQARFQRSNTTWKIVLASLSAVFGVIVAVTKEFLPERSDLVSEVALIVIIPTLIGFYNWFDPAGRRSVHLLVAGQKADTLGKINLQLIQKPKNRARASEFYGWIHSEYSRISGTAMAYIPSSLLDEYPTKSKSD